MHYDTMSTTALLSAILSEEVVRTTYTGTLRTLFREAKRDASLHPLLLAEELIRRYHAEALPGETLTSPGLVKDFLVSTFHGQAYESFITIYLTIEHRVIVAEESFRGSLSQTAVYPREIARRALELTAGAVVVAHNHPSGVAEPSRADEALTQTLKSALALLDVRLLDHLVVGHGQMTSMAERGLL